MRRALFYPRPDWQQIVESQGLAWAAPEPEHGGPPQRYWDESAYYAFSMAEIDRIEAATNELHQMCLTAAGHVIDNKLYDQLAIPARAIPHIEKSWNDEPPSLYGRFDLAVSPTGEIKMLEYNADTPTALLEAAVIQWAWFEQTKQGSDQFNSIHDRLVDTWKYFSDWIKGRVAFTSADSVEDGFTLAYLQETAAQAGYDTESFPMTEMGWDGTEFISGNSTELLTTVFKLYPWEWMMNEEFSAHLGKSNVVWIEPAWKMLLSNKGILPVLWKLFPRHRYLLDAQREAPADLAGWVRKPLLGREGSNVTIFGVADQPGEYGNSPCVYQRDAGIASFDGNYPVVGSWIVGQEAAGIGIRESNTPITGNLSRFIPHVID
jgi:glutathionylspermidine synthase